METIPEDWDASSAVEGYNDYIKRDRVAPHRRKEVTTTDSSFSRLIHN